MVPRRHTLPFTTVGRNGASVPCNSLDFACFLSWPLLAVEFSHSGSDLSFKFGSRFWELVRFNFDLTFNFAFLFGLLLVFFCLSGIGPSDCRLDYSALGYF